MIVGIADSSSILLACSMLGRLDKLDLLLIKEPSSKLDRLRMFMLGRLSCICVLGRREPIPVSSSIDCSIPSEGCRVSRFLTCFSPAEVMSLSVKASRLARLGDS